MAPERKLTKREKKAAAFRSGSKAKGKQQQDVEQLAVPEQDDGDQVNDTVEGGDEGRKLALPPKTRSKKRKRASEGDAGAETTAEEKEEARPAAAAPAEGDGQADDEPPKKKKRQRGGMKKAKPAVDADGKQRRPLFVGNLPYNVTADMIRDHFASCGQTPTVRLLTSKAGPGASALNNAKSKGCAFVEFSDATAIQLALKLHESTLGGRKINVELSAGGGGNSEQRKKKIEEKNKRLNEEREKLKAKRKESHGYTAAPEDGAPAADAGEGKAAPLKTRVKTVVVGGQVKKVRDRRKPKVDQAGNEKVRKRKLEAKARFMTGANAVKIG